MLEDPANIQHLPTVKLIKRALLNQLSVLVQYCALNAINTVSAEALCFRFFFSHH